MNAAINGTYQKEYNAETIFPTALISQTIKLLRQRQARFITYKELTIPRLLPPALAWGNYVLEYLMSKTNRKPNPFVLLRLAAITLARRKGSGAIQSWANRQASRGPITVILQHDADRQPYKTIDVMLEEEKLGVRSSSFFFAERHMWDDDREPYTLDISELKRLEREGFEIGYHLNAYERAEYNLEKARNTINSDIEWLSRHFDIKSFVPHGGVEGVGGLNNDAVPYEGPLRRLNWVYNGRGKHGIGKDTMWSDGDVMQSIPKDPREVAMVAQPGDRVVFLMHPQYYGDRLMNNWERLPIAKEAWWRSLWNLE